VLQGVGRSRVAAPSYGVRADSGLAPFPRTWHNRAGPASRSRPLVRRHLLCRPLADVLGRPLRSSPAASPPGNPRHVLRVRALVVSSRSAAAWAASADAALSPSRGAATGCTLLVPTAALLPTAIRPVLAASRPPVRACPGPRPGAARARRAPPARPRRAGP
jgi:hypothetical protein